eukprot:752032-Hanusia_phi.AAC.1
MDGTPFNVPSGYSTEENDLSTDVKGAEGYSNSTQRNQGTRHSYGVTSKSSLYKMRRWLSSSRHPTRVACNGCRGAKAKCDDERPCRRCIARGITCNEDGGNRSRRQSVGEASERSSEGDKNTGEEALNSQSSGDERSTCAERDGRNDNFSWDTSFDHALLDEALHHVQS